jgi:hypothetical protein
METNDLVRRARDGDHRALETLVAGVVPYSVI